MRYLITVITRYNKMKKESKQNAVPQYLTGAQRQHVITFTLNLAAFLQGASLPTAAISVPRLHGMHGMNETIDTTTWSEDLVLTNTQGDWIGRYK